MEKKIPVGLLVSKSRTITKREAEEDRKKGRKRQKLYELKLKTALSDCQILSSSR